MAGSWISSIGRRIGVRRGPGDPAGPAEISAEPVGQALHGPGHGELDDRPGPETAQVSALPISDSLRSAYAKRKREALDITNHAAAAIAECPTDEAAAAVAKVAEIAHQLAGIAAHFDETDLGDVAAAVDYRLRMASADDQSAIVEAIAELRAALLEAATPAKARRNVHPVSRAQSG